LERIVPFFLFLLLQAALALACLCGIVGLRLRRRGPARFWIGPAVVALVLLPASAAAGITALQFRRVLEGTSLVGSGGIAALATGSAECLLPLCVGLLSVAPLAAAGLVLTAAGTSQLRDESTGGRALWAMLTPLLVLATFGVIAWLVATIASVNAGLHDPGAIQLRWYTAVLGVVGLGVFLLVLAVASLQHAPRGAAPLVVKLVPLSALVLTGLGALAGIVAVSHHIDQIAGIARRSAPTP
jgi:hypothetical protein